MITKILNTEQIRRLDAYTIENEPISSIDLMERASTAFVKWFISHFDVEHSVRIFVGLGNNGGDGLAIARLLTEEKYQVQVDIIWYSDSVTEDFKSNYNRLPQLVRKIEIHSMDEMKSYYTTQEFTNTIYIDALLGSGLSRKPEGLIAEVIQYINESNNKIVSVDIASGLYADKTTEHRVVVNPNYTIAFQIPKLAFFLPQNSKYVGEWNLVDIGLSSKFIKEEKTDKYLIEKNYIKGIYRKREKFSHKGTYGRALLVAGSFGKIDAAVLAANGCLRSGVGLLTVQIPSCGVEILQTSVPEAMVITGKCKKTIDPVDWKTFTPDVIGIGPGIGKDKKALKTLVEILKKFKQPMVIDADAINLLSENPKLLDLVPANSILTPHFKEFERLVGKVENDFHRIEKLISFSKKRNVFTILKGQHTAIVTPEGDVHFNSTGNAGMATGGSGDVLTGILTSLLAQGYSSIEASILGVYLHGLAGDLAANEVGEESLVASDIISFLGKAFLKIKSFVFG